MNVNPHGTVSSNVVYVHSPILGILRSDLLQFGWFNLYLDLNFEEISNLKREI
jgi:hypothetical protein